jgi:hypothetical protein
MQSSKDRLLMAFDEVGKEHGYTTIITTLREYIDHELGDEMVGHEPDDDMKPYQKQLIFFAPRLFFLEEGSKMFDAEIDKYFQSQQVLGHKNQ